MNPAKSATRKATQKSAGSASATARKSKTFTPEELAAMKEHAREMKLATTKVEDEEAVVARIAAMKDPDRTMARRLHAIIKAAAPELAPRLWYGMPAYAKDSKVICFFQDAAKFKSRYATLGFSDSANLDEGPMWSTSYALMKLTSVEEAKIAALVKKAVR